MTMSFNLNRMLIASVASAVLLVSGASVRAEVSMTSISKNYADIAHASYQDSLLTAQSLKKAVTALIAAPSKKTQDAAKAAWKAARIPYQQTEVFRFGNKLIDDWEGKVNAWPLDEGLIDYTGAAYGAENEENPLYNANIIANKVLKIGGKDVDATKITPALLESLQEAGGIEANVATGYHAIEFLLWGQDLNGTKAGAGARPATDFDVKNCTGGNCDRRGAYLVAATDLLIKDLNYAVGLWAKDGKVRASAMANGGAAGVKAMLIGMGSLSYGELAGDRIKLGLMLHDPEEEHDCFSDNTHASHYYDVVGIQNVYLGGYKRADGSVVKGVSLAQYMAVKNAKMNDVMIAKIKATLDAASVIVKRAEGGEAYDQMIGAGNKEGNAVIQTLVDKLSDQTKAIERVLAVLNVKGAAISGSDALK